MKITFLGTGTSHGVPFIGCKCDTCVSSDPKDKRLNSSIMIENEEKVILIDCGADFRHQALKNNILRVDAVLVTHHHFDHIVGLDNLRVYNHKQQHTIPIYGHAFHLNYMRQYIFHYMFGDAIQKGGGISELTLLPVENSFDVEGINFECLPVMHGKMHIYGYRFNDVTYISDVSEIPLTTMEQIKGTRILIIDALRYRPHSTHFSLSEAIDVINYIKPEKAYLTHICHDMKHSDVNNMLKDSSSEYFSSIDIELAYDGLSFSV